MIVKCEEKWSENPDAADAVWASNGDQLHYPNVSTCITVTLVFQNGLLGGHASQSTIEVKDSKIQPGKNLRGVIQRMISVASDNHALGAFRKICFIGTTPETDWELDEATKLITNHFGEPSMSKRLEVSAKKVDIVFDTSVSTLYTAAHKKKDQTVAETIKLAEDDDTFMQYV